MDYITSAFKIWSLQLWSYDK